MIGLGGPRRARAAVDRRADRLVAMVGIVVALGYLAAAVLSAFLPVTQRVGAWLPLHLALAGGAASAVAGVMPFFSAAFATAQPVDARVRWASLVAVAVGAAGASLGYAEGPWGVGIAGGLLFVVGMGLVGIATFAPLAGGLGPRGGAVALGYGAALVMVSAGAILATLFLAGWLPVVSSWPWLKPAHAWLNLVGFVSLVVATTLLHFFPTVIGARIRRTWTAHATVGGLALGAALVATGFALRSDLVARIGAASVVVGAVALTAYAVSVWRTKASWTGDEGWHRFAMGGLVSAIAWFELGMLVAAGRVLASGTDPAGTGSDPLIGPLVVGWMGLAVLASATHLVPAVGPGGPAAHARQRQLLGRGGGLRIVLADIGVAALTVGISSSIDPLNVLGMLAVAVAMLSSLLLLLAAIGAGIRDARRGS